MDTNSTNSSQTKGGFWSEIFPPGPNRQEILRQLSSEIGARYTPAGFLQFDKVQLAYKSWTITLEIYESSTGRTSYTCTHFRLPYITSDGFRFNIYRAGFFSRLGVKLGMQDIKIGEEPFDDDFIIQGNSEVKLREFLSSNRLRHLISFQPQIRFYARDSEGMFGPLFPPSACELNFLVPIEILDVGRLEMIFELHKEAIEQLLKIGSASKQRSKVRL